VPQAAEAWIESLTPWPREFGLERMQALVAALGDPQRAFPSVHVVGTNGKSTATRTVEELLAAEGLTVGAYLSPHVRGWSERIRVGGKEADFGEAIDRVRADAERLEATQFEVLTAAAFAAFAAAGVDAAVVEAGLGGRLDATNVIDAPVVLLTNVALDHTEVLGATREEIAAEKLAVVGRDATVVLGEPEWEPLARENGAAHVVVTSPSSVALAHAAAVHFLGRDLDPSAARELRLPGRLERRSDEPLEIWDGAHNMAGVGWLLPRLPTRRWTLVVSILAAKNVDGMLEALSVLGDDVVTTQSTNPRTVSAEALAERAQRFFGHVESVPDPHEAVERARALAGPQGAVLVTGSLYVLADLSRELAA
jgi:dihydrofolate synthase / folylpolyglutamate synthase